MEDIVDPAHRRPHAAFVAHVAQIEFNPRAVVPLAHIVLLLLVAAKDAYLTQPRVEKTPQHGISEGAGPTGDEQGLVVEHDRF